MNRFSRMSEVRRLQEEAAANEVGRIQGRIAQLRVEIAALEEQTAQGRVVALDDLPDGEHRLPPELYESYFQGQSWRRQRIEEEIRRLEETLKVALQAWNESRIRLKQVERLEEKEGLTQRVEEERREARTRDDRSASMHHLRTLQARAHRARGESGESGESEE